MRFACVSLVPLLHAFQLLLLLLLFLLRHRNTSTHELTIKHPSKPSATVSPPCDTQPSPPNEVVRRDHQWNYLDSPLNLIPIPRAPIPTFGEVTPRPQVWHREDTFFPVLRNGSITVHGPSNYLLRVSSTPNRITLEITVKVVE
ncbi:unnamed protein product [Hydatigera taeniaeformis]|uniref:Secreted protein n=1 Tax=Hydatigena taeniaeformis TaxID=6205 RepID=A0A0R3WUJ1_HYDTA|nr:unnamed protein product [Hydatigera taeniaeformis]